MVALVIVAEKMQKPMKRQDLELGQLGVARVARLTPRHASGDDDVPEKGIRD